MYISTLSATGPGTRSRRKFDKIPSFPGSHAGFSFLRCGTVSRICHAFSHIKNMRDLREKRDKRDKITHFTLVTHSTLVTHNEKYVTKREKFHHFTGRGSGSTLTSRPGKAAEKSLVILRKSCHLSTWLKKLAVTRRKSEKKMVIFPALAALFSRSPAGYPP